MTSPGGVSLPVVTLFLLTFALALPTADNGQTPGPRISVVQDWSHRHLIFGGGGSLEALVAAARDPRARNQWLLRNHGRFQAARDSNRNSDPFALGRESGRFDDPFGMIEQGKKGKEPRRKQALDIDWAFSLGSLGGVVAGTFPAKFSFDVTVAPSCTNDFVVFPINATPGTGQANIIALQNLYVNAGKTGFCGPGVLDLPTVRWAYYVNGGGPVKTSPVLSLDGTKVAFIESVTGGAVFSVLTPGTPNPAGTVGAPLDATSVITRLVYTPAQTGCTGPSGAANTRSSPFVDYTTDTAYVGADNGYIYKIHPVFGLTGTPAVTACAQVTTGSSLLTSPVYDPTAQRVFIADGAAASSLYAFPANLGTPATIAPAIGTITDGPIVDGTNRFAYVFGGVSGQAGNLAQVQWAANPFTAWGTPTTTRSLSGGTSSTGTIRSGAFDDAYFTGSGPRGNPSSGYLYACGYGGTATNPSNRVGLFGYAFAPSTGVLKAGFGPNEALSPLTGSTAAPASCSPITSFKNGSVDRMFVSTTATTPTTAYTFEMWPIGIPLTLYSTIGGTGGAAITVDTAYSGGTSGIIVDNTSSGAQASSIYFGTLSNLTTICGQTSGVNNYCAVKLTQSGLQ